jgi:hypothetical protein
MPLAESLRRLGPLTQKHLHGLLLSFLQKPSGDTYLDPLKCMQRVAQTADAPIQLMYTVLAINVHGQSFFQQPKKFPRQMRGLNIVLDGITSGGALQVNPNTRQTLPPSPLDGQHLKEWRETAD